MPFVYFTDRDLGKQFPAVLRAAGLRVERHGDHFAPATPDEEWIRWVAARGWVAVTHDARIRYKANEKAAVMASGLALLVVVGKAPHPELARGFVNTAVRIESFLARHSPPFIAKVYAASAADLARDASAAGRVEMWYP